MDALLTAAVMLALTVIPAGLVLLGGLYVFGWAVRQADAARSAFRE